MSYFGCQVVLTWKKNKAFQIEREAQNDIEMQKIISDINTKVIMFKPRSPK